MSPWNGFKGLFIMLVLCCPVLLISPGQNFTGNPTPPPASSSTRHMFIFRVTLALVFPMKAISCLNQPVFQTVLYDVKRKYLFFRKFILFFLGLGPQRFYMPELLTPSRPQGTTWDARGQPQFGKLEGKCPTLYYCLSPLSIKIFNFFPFLVVRTGVFSEGGGHSAWIHICQDPILKLWRFHVILYATDITQQSFWSHTQNHRPTSVQALSNRALPQFLKFLGLYL